MNSGDDNQQGPQASTPQQIAELFNSYFVSVFTAPSEIRTLSAHFTSSHPTLNELEIPVEMVLTSLKQLACSRLRDGGGKSFSNKKCKKRAAATAPFPKSCASYFRFARFNTFPLYYLRAWHRLSNSLI